MPDKESIIYELEEQGDINMKMIDNYRDLPIGMYLEICEIDKRKDIEDIAKQVSIIALLTGKSEEEIYNSSIEEYKEMAKKSAFLSHPYDGEVLTAKIYRIEDWVLQPVEDFRKITTAQYIDFQTFAQFGEEKIVEIISVMLVPKGKKYNQGYDVVELQNALRQHLSVADAISLFAFFFVQYNRLIKDSLTSCREAAMKLRDPEKKRRTLRELDKQERNLLKNGGGLRM